MSKDLDFVSYGLKREKLIASAMDQLGFKKKRKSYFHQETPFFVEFISGAVVVGDEVIQEIHEIEMATGVLRIIPPTDCVKDRIAAFYHFRDRQGLEQAVLVALNHKIDMHDIRNWPEKEKKLPEFEEFRNRVSG